ncbi:MAG: DUF6938 domain-containing protein [Candidatus Hydrogenedentota bacterium]
MIEDSQPVMFLGNPVSPKIVRKAQRMRTRYLRKYGYDPDTQYAMAAVENPVLGPALGVRNVVANAPGEPLDPGNGVLIGTIRMGYGHYRIAMAVASAAHALGRTPYWFDLLGFDAPGARMIHDLDFWYSLGSRLSQQSRVFNRFVWEPLMGSAYRRLEKNYPIREVCAIFANLHHGLPKTMPFLGTHPWCSHGAVHGAMQRVVNLIPDNWPLGFHPAEGALNTVQTPSAYTRFRTLAGMGPKHARPNAMPPDALALAGHYVDHDLVANAETDCAARIARLDAQKPRRILLSVGGAGAQRQLYTGIIRTLLPYVRDGAVTLFVNFGDHAAFFEHIAQVVPEFGEAATVHRNWEDTRRAAADTIDGGDAGLHAFLHEDTFAAVYTTNVLMRACDVLLTKPSELAFYPIPTVLLKRVGAHEAWGAIRAAELGYGTPECEDWPQTAQLLRLVAEEDDFIRMACERIPKLRDAGIFDGAYRAVEWAMG